MATTFWVCVSVYFRPLLSLLVQTYGYACSFHEVMHFTIGISLVYYID